MIGERIKNLRKEQGYSITELARLANVSKSYLSQIEKGFQSNPSLQFLYKISLPLGTNVNYFLDETNEHNSSHMELDLEWVELIREAVEDGITKKDFKEYFNFLKYQSWLNAKNIHSKKNPHS